MSQVPRVSETGSLLGGDLTEERDLAEPELPSEPDPLPVGPFRAEASLDLVDGIWYWRRERFVKEYRIDGKHIYYPQQPDIPPEWVLRVVDTALTSERRDQARAQGATALVCNLAYSDKIEDAADEEEFRRILEPELTKAATTVCRREKSESGREEPGWRWVSGASSEVGEGQPKVASAQLVFEKADLTGRLRDKEITRIPYPDRDPVFIQRSFNFRAAMDEFDKAQRTRLDEAQREMAKWVQEYLKSLVGKSCATLEENQQMAREVSDLVSRYGLCLLFPSKESNALCLVSVRVVHNKKKNPLGAFHVRTLARAGSKSRTSLFAQPTWPTLVVAAPCDVAGLLDDSTA